MQLLFFHADYCPPCKQMQPVAEQFSIETGIPLYQFRCNDGYDGNALARQHHVKRLPCLILLGDDGLERTRTEAILYDRKRRITLKHLPTRFLTKKGA